MLKRNRKTYGNFKNSYVTWKYKTKLEVGSSLIDSFRLFDAVWFKKKPKETQLLSWTLLLASSCLGSSRPHGLHVSLGGSVPASWDIYIYIYDEGVGMIRPKLFCGRRQGFHMDLDGKNDPLDDWLYWFFSNWFLG